MNNMLMGVAFLAALNKLNVFIGTVIINKMLAGPVCFCLSCSSYIKGKGQPPRKLSSHLPISSGGEWTAHPELQFAWGQALKAGGREKREKLEGKCLILSFPCLRCLCLIFQDFSAVQLCPQTRGSVPKKKERSKTYTYSIMLWGRPCVGGCFSSLSF